MYDDVRVQQQLAVDLARQGSEQLNKLQAREAELRSAVHAHQAALSMVQRVLNCTLRLTVDAELNGPQHAQVGQGDPHRAAQDGRQPPSVHSGPRTDPN